MHTGCLRFFVVDFCATESFIFTYVCHRFDIIWRLLVDFHASALVIFVPVEQYISVIWSLSILVKKCTFIFIFVRVQFSLFPNPCIIHLWFAFWSLMFNLMFVYMFSLVSFTVDLRVSSSISLVGISLIFVSVWIVDFRTLNSPLAFVWFPFFYFHPGFDSISLVCIAHGPSVAALFIRCMLCRCFSIVSDDRCFWYTLYACITGVAHAIVDCDSF